MTASGSNGHPPVFELRNVAKFYGSTTALHDVSLSIRPGRILALLGDNGAGKSTIVKVLSGSIQPDEGTMLIHGKPVRLASPKQARELGIATVFQDLAICGLLSITRNVVLGNEPTRRIGPLRFYDPKAAESEARKALSTLGVHLRRGYNELAGTASGGERQALAIARAMHYGSACLILDEPTSALAVRQANRVLEHTVIAKNAGQAVVLIMHNIAQALSVADDIVVLGHGRVRGSFRREECEVDQITELVSRV